MRFANRFFFTLALCAVLGACKSGDDDDSGNAATGTGGMVATGSGGTLATGAGGMVATGAGGMVATGTGGMVATGTGGMVATGTGGMVATGTGGTGSGTGGMGVAGAGGGTGGTGSGTGGTAGGTGGTGSGTGGMGGDTCESDVIAQTPSTTADCASCLCSMCNAEVTAMKGDTKAQALLDCGQMHNCSGNCCFCGAPCDMLGSNYGMGPCAMETAAAAGVSSTTDLSMASTLMTACGMMGSSCNKPSVLADCETKNCADKCPPVAECK